MGFYTYANFTTDARIRKSHHVHNNGVLNTPPATGHEVLNLHSDATCLTHVNMSPYGGDSESESPQLIQMRTLIQCNASTDSIFEADYVL